MGGVLTVKAGREPNRKLAVIVFVKHSKNLVLLSLVVVFFLWLLQQNTLKNGQTAYVSYKFPKLR